MIFNRTPEIISVYTGFTLELSSWATRPKT